MTIYSSFSLQGSPTGQKPLRCSRINFCSCKTTVLCNSRQQTQLQINRFPNWILNCSTYLHATRFFPAIASFSALSHTAETPGKIVGMAVVFDVPFEDEKLFWIAFWPLSCRTSNASGDRAYSTPRTGRTQQNAITRQDRTTTSMTVPCTRLTPSRTDRWLYKRGAHPWCFVQSWVRWRSHDALSTTSVPGSSVWSRDLWRRSEPQISGAEVTIYCNSFIVHGPGT